jgi:hypothetical protein
MTVAAGMTSNDGGVGTFRENHRTGNECHSDIERIREYGHREIKTLLKPGAIVELFPGTPDVVNTDQVTMNGGVRQVWYIRDHTKSGQHRASKRGRADDHVRRVDEDQGVRPPDVAIDERIAHVEACDMSGNRVQQCATAVVTANGDKPSGKFHHSGMKEMRRSILATLATNMIDDLGQTCEASGMSDCTATVMAVASLTQTSAAAPTGSAAPPTAGSAKSSHGTVGVDVMYRRAPIEPMECDTKYDDNGDKAMANRGTVFNERDGLFETIGQSIWKEKESVDDGEGGVEDACGGYAGDGGSDYNGHDDHDHDGEDGSEYEFSGPSDTFAGYA